MSAPSPAGRLLSRRARVALVAALGSVVGMAFAVSWTALRDVATAIGIPGLAATLYPFVVDGLMALALVATLVLDGPARKIALRVLAAYTAASLTLNYVHGLVPALHNVAAGDRVRLAGVDWAHWGLVGLAAALPVGAIYFGSDLVARVLHHRPESTPTEDTQSAPEQQEQPTPAPVPAAPIETEQRVLESAPAAAESTPAPVTAAPGESTPTMPTVDPDPLPETTPTETAPSEPSRPRPRRATGPVPAAAKADRPPRRTLEQLLTEARALPEDDQRSAEQIRLALRVGPPRARELRDLLADEREAATAPVPLRAVPTEDLELLAAGSDR
jgi:hypothetical protein